MIASDGRAVFVRAVAGAGGGVFASLVLQPLEVTKTRIQVEQSRRLSPSEAVREVIEQDGPLGLLRGAGTKCLDTGSRYFVYFFAYEAIGGFARRCVAMTAMVNILVGYMAGVVAVSATTPFDVASTKLQAGTARGGLVGLLAQILGKDGLAGLYVGYGYNLALCVNPAISNTLFDRIKGALLLRRRHSLASGGAGGGSLGGGGASGCSGGFLTSFEAFVLGAFTKAVAVLLTYPLTRLKTIRQAGGPLAVRDEPAATDAEPKRRLPAPGSLAGGLRTAYLGLGSQLLKAVLQAAFLYMAKERIEGFVVKSIQMLLSVHARPALKLSQ